jgi:putative transposase
VFLKTKIMGTFSKIYIQIFYAVAKRESLIGESWEDKLYKYISGIVIKQD